jgi:hypothetical protein
MQQLWNDVAAIFTAPFAGNLDLRQLFLIVGAVLIFAVAWAFILRHIEIAATEI